MTDDSWRVTDGSWRTGNRAVLKGGGLEQNAKKKVSALLRTALILPYACGRLLTLNVPCCAPVRSTFWRTTLWKGKVFFGVGNLGHGTHSPVPHPQVCDPTTHFLHFLPLMPLRNSAKIQWQ